MAVKKVFYYTNQFYAGIGGEESASIGLEFRDGAVGPAAFLQQELGAGFEVVTSAVCGDNTIAEKGDELVPQIVEAVRQSGAELFVAGPAFNAGRFGLGCGYTTAAVTEQLKIPAVTAMYSENPGTDLYKNRCYILQTGNNARHLKEVISAMAVFAKRLCSGDEILDGKAEHYHGTGPAIDIDYTVPAAKRGIDMLLAKFSGKKFRTEVIMPNHEEIPVPQLTKPLSQCKIGLVTDGGLVPLGNPDKQVPTNSKFFRRYSIEGMETLKAEDWEVSHQGYNSAFVRQDPNRLVPVDALRHLVKQGVIGSLNEVFYSTAAVMTPMEKCKEFGEGIAKALIADGCDAVIETST